MTHITRASNDNVLELQDEVAKILDILGHPEALITDVVGIGLHSVRCINLISFHGLSSY